MIDKGRLIVLYGSQTFTAQEAAERIWRTTKILDFKGPVQAMDDYPISRLIHEEFALFICATTGQGDEPDNMRKFWKFLLRKSLPSNSLVNLKFGVIGFGDSKYSKFNFVAKKLHKRLIQLGAKPLLDLGKLSFSKHKFVKKLIQHIHSFVWHNDFQFVQTTEYSNFFFSICQFKNILFNDV